ncbi:MAG: HD domain-containing phosphohydrolase [Campylobacterota bacterium]|nr:HD domain-containing phosphohydrolase [Campylobacterota bacterium]
MTFNLNQFLLALSDALDFVEIDKEHCDIGENNIKNFPFLTEHKNIVKYHHEKLDGSGYPYGLKADEISFESKLMGCLDIYQALREDRPYREGLGHKKSIMILKENAAKGYIDSNIVNDIDTFFK